MSLTIIKGCFLQTIQVPVNDVLIRSGNLTAKDIIAGGGISNFYEQSGILQFILTEAYYNSKISDSWNLVSKSNYCLLFFGANDPNYVQCNKSGDGVLKDGLSQGIFKFNDNMRQLVCSFQQSNFNNKYFMLNEELVDLYLKNGYDYFVSNYIEIFKSSVLNSQAVVFYLVALVSVSLVIFLTFVYVKKLSLVIAYFKEIITMFCVLPNKILKDQSVLSRLSLIELK